MTDARTLTIELSGKWHGRYGVAPCPVCQSARRKEQNALTLSDGDNRLLVHCKKSSCDFRDIATAAGIMDGTYTPPDPALHAQREAMRRAEAAKRLRQAKAIWSEAQPISGTVAEAYLRGRCITCALPNTLRYHPAAWHGATAKRLPALVALVDGGDGFAVHRTYLRPDGLGKADVEPAKAMLGATSGGAVRVTEGDGPLVITEGVETALSLASGLLPAPVTVWAALSTSGMQNLRLPPDLGRLMIAPDGDKPGRKAANTLAERAHALGWDVSLLPAPDGRDWNDFLTMKGETA